VADTAIESQIHTAVSPWRCHGATKHSQQKEGSTKISAPAQSERYVPGPAHPQRILTSGITQLNSSSLHGSRHAKSSPSGRRKSAGRRWNHPQNCRSSRFRTPRRTFRASQGRIIGPSSSMSTLGPMHHLLDPRNVQWKPRTHGQLWNPFAQPKLVQRWDRLNKKIAGQGIMAVEGVSAGIRERNRPCGIG
jgi:hypothetical protein